jgi:NADH-quinone oxidoreductase subunit C
MFERIVTLAGEASRQQSPVVDENASPKAINIHPDDLVAVCRVLYENEETFFDMLSCITGIDNGPDKGTIEVAYNLYSIPFDVHIMLKVSLPRINPELDSVSAIWKTANWHERELFDMFGIHIRNHPDLRRILLPADWEGHPLRKDYKHQEYYKNIKLDY